MRRVAPGAALRGATVVGRAAQERAGRAEQLAWAVWLVPAVRRVLEVWRAPAVKPEPEVGAVEAMRVLEVRRAARQLVAAPDSRERLVPVEQRVYPAPLVLVEAAVLRVGRGRQAPRAPVEDASRTRCATTASMTIATVLSMMGAPAPVGRSRTAMRGTLRKWGWGNARRECRPVVLRDHGRPAMERSIPIRRAAMGRMKIATERLTTWVRRDAARPAASGSSSASKGNGRAAPRRSLAWRCATGWTMTAPGVRTTA